MDKEYLDKTGHAPLDYVAYYDVVEMNKESFQQKSWFYPVSVYVFGGNYPEDIYVKGL